MSRLEEALAIAPDAPLAVDGTIQRFEFVFELFWKTLRRFLIEEGEQPSTPRETLRAAFAAGWIKDERAWLELLDARNETTHTYDEEKAREVYEAVKREMPALQATLGSLTARARTN